jgi:TRAP-type uncharacterized transport system fused permease subunit
MRAMMEAMRFGAVKYALPFFFIYNPALVLQDDSWVHIAEVFAAAVIGLGLVAYSLQGYLPWVGAVTASPIGYALRIVLTLAGLLLALPERITTVIGLAVALAAYVVAAILARTGRTALTRTVS